LYIAIPIPGEVKSKTFITYFAPPDLGVKTISNFPGSVAKKSVDLY